MTYDLSPREAEVIDSYRELPPKVQEYARDLIISFCEAKNIITGIRSESKNPDVVEGEKRPDETEGTMNT